MHATPAYEVFAIKYAHHERRASANFIGGDSHDAPMPLDCFVWLIRGAGREIVVDSKRYPAASPELGIAVRLDAMPQSR